MTMRELGAALGRRWYVVLLVLAIAGGVGFALLRTGGVYTSSTIVSFMLPDKTSLSLNSGLDDASVIAFAGVVAQEINNGKPPARYSTDDAPFYGAGVREGVLVTLPNAGNQWVSAYLRAEVQLQVVGTTEAWVADTQAQILRDIDQVTEALQVSVQPESSRITANVVPLTKRIIEITPSRSTQIGAFTALGAAALIVGGWLALMTDRLILAASARRRRSPAQTNQRMAT